MSRKHSSTRWLGTIIDMSQNLQEKVDWKKWNKELSKDIKKHRNSHKSLMHATQSDLVLHLISLYSITKSWMIKQKL